MSELWHSLISNFTRPPALGVPTNQLTDRDKIALAIAAGCKVSTRIEDGKFIVTTDNPIGVSTDPFTGKYIVAEFQSDKIRKGTGK